MCAATFASGDALPPVRVVGRSGGGLRARASDQGFLPIDTQKYVMLLDWTGREIRENKCGAIPDNLACLGVCNPLTVLSRLSPSGDADDLSACMSFFAKPYPRQWPCMFRRQREPGKRADRLSKRCGSGQGG